MAFTLDGQNIKAPKSLNEKSDTLYAQQRTLQGTINRDYFGDRKRVWTLSYSNTNKTDFDIMNTIYQSYLSTNTPKSWVVTETNYTVSATTVHMNLDARVFKVGGEDYISDFTLVLSEV